MDEQKSNSNFIIQLGLTIPILTFIAVGGVYYYEAGYFDSYNIDKDFIEVELTKNVGLIFELIDYLLIVYGLLILYLYVVHRYFHKLTALKFIFPFIPVISSLASLGWCHNQTAFELVIAILGFSVLNFIANMEGIYKEIPIINSIPVTYLKSISGFFLVTTFFFWGLYGMPYDKNKVSESKCGEKTFLIRKYSDCVIWGIPDSISNNELRGYIIERGKGNSDTFYICK